MKQIFTCFLTFLSIFSLAQNDGILDSSFGTSGYVKYNSQAYGTCLELDTNQNLIVGTYNYSEMFKFYRFSQAGQLDTTFGTNGVATVSFGGEDALLNDMILQPDNKIIAAGYWNDGNNRSDFIIIRLNADGSLDTTFNGTGKLTIAFGTGEDVAESLVMQPDGKILVAGYSFTGSYTDFALARINTNGTLDTTFSGDGKLTTDFLGNNDYAKSVALSKDGKIGVSGYSYSGNSADFSVAKYNADGTLDTSFSSDGKQVITLGANNDNCIGIAFQNDNKIILGGAYFKSSGRDDFAIVRLTASGSLDTSFSGDGIFSTAIGTSDDTPRAMKVQNDGKILLVGDVSSGSYTDIGVIRVTTSGNLDSTFGTGGIARQAYGNGSSMYDMAFTTSGNLYLCGHAGNDILLARFGSSPTLSAAENTAKTIEIYPNPVTDILNLSQTVQKAELYSTEGKLIKTDNNVDKLNLNNLPKGIYNLKINLADQKNAVIKKIIKK